MGRVKCLKCEKMYMQKGGEGHHFCDDCWDIVMKERKKNYGNLTQDKLDEYKETTSYE